MTTIQKVILTITIIIYALFILLLIVVYFAQGGCQDYYPAMQQCLRYGQPQMYQYFKVWGGGTVILLLIFAPIYELWGKNKREEKPKHEKEKE